MKQGDYIRKQNYTEMLGSGMPVIKIKDINKVRINGIECMSRESFVVITKEEAHSIMELYNTMTVSPIPVEVKEFVCKREDTGAPKVPISVFAIKKILFHYKMSINPDIEAYMCPICGHYHLGKQINNINEKLTE